MDNLDNLDREHRDDLDDRIGALAALGDPVRRALYRFAARQDRSVSRDEAAAAVGVSRAGAAFHLDRLVAEGLLETEFRRLGDRRGPGAGRPSKLYRRADRDIAVSLPPRHYDLVGHVLAAAVTDAARRGVPIDTAVATAASEHGRRLGREGSTVLQALADQGYEPRPGQHEISLANCPFHALVAHHPQLVCGMNVALVQGVLDGAGADDLEAVLDPKPGRCCVTVVRR